MNTPDYDKFANAVNRLAEICKALPEDRLDDAMDCLILIAEVQGDMAGFAAEQLKSLRAQYEQGVEVARQVRTEPSAN